MLSDRERAILAELQDRLATDDPRFARSFRAGLRRLRPAKPRLRPVATWTAVVLAALLCLLMLVVGATTTALFFACAAGVLAWTARRDDRAKPPTA